MSPQIAIENRRIICNGPKPRKHHNCHRDVLWRVGKLFFCAPHFDEYLEANWDALEKYEIERLSDEDRDFDQYTICQVPRPREDEHKEDGVRVCR